MRQNVTFENMMLPDNMQKIFFVLETSHIVG
jgi:hypothetical protein